MSARGRRSFWGFVAVAGAVLMAQQLAHDSPFVQQPAVARVISVAASLAKLAGQAIGAAYAFLNARQFGVGSPVRGPWLLVAAWFATYFVGQLVLVFYAQILHVSPPVPSVGDAMFTAGYACIILALVRFVSAYRASGFPVGRFRDHALIAVAACALFAVVAYVVLLPIALAPSPLVERAINVGYPLLDLVVLVPTLQLLAIMVSFRGGRLASVWWALLAGVLFGAGGDFVFADISPEHVAAIGPLADLLFVLAYGFSAYGAYLQHELLTE